MDETRVANAATSANWTTPREDLELDRFAGLEVVMLSVPPGYRESSARRAGSRCRAARDGLASRT
jgi:hypothetical protein